MAACPLRDDQVKKLYKKVTADLLDYVGKNTPFDIKQYSKDLYTKMYNQSKDHNLAINYIQMIPATIIEAQSRSKDIRNLVKDSYPQIVDMEDNDFNKTVDFLELGTDVVNEIKAAQAVLDKTPIGIIPTEVTPIKGEPAKPHSAFTTTGFETLPNSNDPNPEKKTLYTVLKNILDKLFTPSVDMDSRNLDLPGVQEGGLHLTAMAASRVSFNDLYPETQRWLQEPGKEAEHQAMQDEGVVMILTDIQGNPIRFKDDGTTAFGDEGKPMYYMMRKPRTNMGQFGLVNAPIQSPVQAAKTLSKLLGREVTSQEAEAIQQSHLQDIDAIRKYIGANPQSNQVRTYISGGSKGLVDSHPSIQTAFSKLNFSVDHPFDPKMQFTVDGPFDKGSAYFNYPGIDQPIRLQRREFTDEIATKIASLLVDDITLNGEALSPFDKMKYVKSYVQTTKDGIAVDTTDDGKNLLVVIKGTLIDLSKKEEAKKLIQDHLTDWSATKVAKPTEGKPVLDGTKADWEKDLYQGRIVRKLDASGKEVFYRYNRNQINVDEKFFKRMEDFTDFDIKDGKLIPTEKNFKDFLGEHTFINYSVDSTGKLNALNGYFEYTPLQEDMEKVFPKDTAVEEAKTEIPSKTKVEPTAADDTMDDLFEKISGLNKLVSQKREGAIATKEDLVAAKAWYENHPMREHIPFEAFFNMVNTAEPNGIARWTLNGITLYKGSDYSDLYHEAWHGFTQGYLTKAQKTALYEELRKKSGSFKTHTGSTTTFFNASNLELEEYLAEDFRKYMLSHGKTTGGKTRNAVFQKILDFFKFLFGDSTISEVAINGKANKYVHDIYEKLRVGDLNQWSFSADNATHSVLNLGVEAINDTEPVKNLKYEDSKLLTDSMDSLISEFIDRSNAKHGTSKYTSIIVNNPQGIIARYQYVQRSLARIRNGMAATVDAIENPIEKQEQQKQIELLDWALRNFGDPEHPNGNENSPGLISYHLRKSKFLPQNDLFTEIDPTAEDSTSRNSYDRSGNESSLIELASKEVLYMIKGLNDIEKGVVKKNKLGINQLVDFDLVWNRLAKVLQGSLSPQQMVEKLNTEAKNDPEYAPIINQLLGKLGPVNNTQNTSEFNTWTGFYNAFRKTRVPLIQMTLDRVTVRNPDGTVTYNYIAKIGEASTDFKKAGQAWDNTFQITYDNPYIKADKNNINHLDIPAILKAFPNVKGREFEFFNALGVILSDKKEIREGVAKLQSAPYIRTKLINLQKRGLVINRVSDIFNLEADADNEFPRLDKEGRSWKALQVLETRYSEQYSNFSVTNAEGNPQFEHTLNSSLTIMANSINDAKSVDDLIAMPHMAHLDPNRNPLIKNSLWFNSLFDLSQPTGPKRRDGNTFVKFNLENLSGVQLTRDEESTNIGVSSAGADPFTKFLLDFHNMVLRGTPEFMRHSDKGSSFSGSVSRVLAPGNKSAKMYVETEEFIANPDKASSNLQKIITGYISGELARIQRIKNASDNDTIYNTPEYAKAGQEFVMFDDVLSKPTKDALKSLDQPLDVYLKTNTDESVELQNSINKDIDIYFAKQIKATEDRYNRSAFSANNIVTAIKDGAQGTVYATTVSKAKNVDVLAGALKSFTINSWIHNMESITMLYGDVAQYNLAKEEFHKRNAGIASTGEGYRTDQAAMDYVNNTLGFGYAASKGIAQDPFGPILNSAILEDTKTRSVYYKAYHDSFKKEFEERAALRGITGNQLVIDTNKYLFGDGTYEDPKGDGVMVPYTNMKEGDGQGWATFDSYRALLSLQNKWSNAQEEIYQKIIKGESVNIRDIHHFFPVQKLQYWGPLHSADQTSLPVIAFHKFSVFPLIPTVVKGTNLEGLHTKMMTDNIHYATFKSGSKVTTITDKGVIDKLYTSQTNRSFSSDKPYTKNPVFLHYLKNQLETAPEYKSKVIFSTQLRKLIEDGLMEGGVPTDYMQGEPLDKRIAAWSKVTDESQRRSLSNRYTLLKEYEDNIRKLTEVKKRELLREAGWVIGKDGQPKGDLKPLLKFVRSELSRQDLADHEIDFIDVKPNSNELVHDLSMSLSAEKIEKLLTAIVNKRLIRQKVNGESLIQVSGAGFERTDAFGPGRNLINPTEGDLKKYGSNDLPTYHPGDNGKTRAMKVKIAMQGKFEQLLELDSVKNEALDKKISRIDALNSLLRDEPWLNSDNNRQMVTMIGVRIPVQGLNSMEHMEVYEFLPKEAGNIIVPPAEVVAKSGSDFDIDKLTIMMPNLRKDIDGKVILSTQYSKAEAKILYDKLLTHKIRLAELRDTSGNIVRANDNAVDKLLKDIFGNFWEMEYTEDEINDLTKEYNIQNFGDFFETLNGSKAVENDLLMNMKNILELKENFSTLARPNGTDIVKPLADKLEKYVQDYNPKSRTFPGDESSISGTRVMELEYNLYKHMTNNIGKQTLGMGAVDNSYNVVFNRIGARMSPSYDAVTKGGKVQTRPLTLYLDHNVIDVNGQPAISLSHTLDANNKNKISDVIGQLINGWVDIAKDTWIFNLQGNKEVTPTLLFLVQAGVPFEQAVYFVSQPLIRDYVNEQRLAKSTFGDPLGTAPSNPNFYKIQAIRNILVKHDFGLTSNDLRGNPIKSQAVYDLTKRLAEENPDAFKSETMLKNIEQPSVEITDEQKAVFLHYLEIEEMAKSIRDIKLRMNFDTKKSSTLFDAQNRQLQVEILRADGRIPSKIVDDILENSPMGSFNIQDFMVSLWGPLFHLRNSDVVNNFLLNKFRGGISGDVDNTFGDPEKFVAEFKNDLMSYVFQNSVQTFDLNKIKNYKGYNVNDTMPVQAVKSLVHGVFVKDGVMYVDKKQLEKDWRNKAYTGTVSLNSLATAYNGDTNLATLNTDAFIAKKEYFKFVFEREYLRSIFNADKLKTNKAFQHILTNNIVDKKLVKRTGETDEQFSDRLKKVSYEQFLRDQALDNVFNSQKMFESDSSYADEFTQIKAENRNLEQNYLLFKLMAQSNSRSGLRNLFSTDGSLDADKLNILHQNLRDLANPAVSKVADPIENDRISDFFSKFPVYAFMQSGLTTKGKFSLIRFVPLDMYTAIMTEPVKTVTAHVTPAILDKFYRRFTALNGEDNKRDRFRHKNYVVEENQPAVSADSPAITDYAEGIKEYNPTNFLAEGTKMRAMVETNPDLVFVYNQTSDPNKTNYQKTDAAIQEAAMGFTSGLPTKSQYPEGTELKPNAIIENSMTDATLDENKRLIDTAIQKLVNLKESGRTLVFNKNGYGQGMVGRNNQGKKIIGALEVAPQTFQYLGEQLSEKLGYINNGLLLTKPGSKFVQSTQPVSDEEVMEFMKTCLNF
jgi:hypothetical protein